MFESSFRLGKIAGVEVSLNISLLLMGALLTFSMADVYYPQQLPALSRTAHIGLGFITALLFFASILWHEIAHALMAKFFQIPVKRIVLNFFGGIAEIEHEPRHAYQELWISAIGPISTALLGGAFLLLSRLLGSDTTLGTMGAWLGLMNLILAVLNMIPGFPLDGGRVFRALIWWVTGNHLRATRIAVRTGQLFAILIALVGLAEIFLQSSPFGGLWTLFIAWFLWASAKGHLTFTQRQHSLEAIPIRALLRPRVKLQPDWSIVYALDVMSMNNAGSVATVVANNQVVGIFSLEAVLPIPRLRWETLRVDNLMKSIVNLPRVNIDSNVFHTLREMERLEAPFVLITQEAETVGIASRYELVKLAHNYQALRQV